MAYNFNNFKEELKKINEWLSGELSHFHTGRANVGLLDGVMISAYGALTPLSHVGGLATEDPKTIRVSPWDKSLVKEIERAITSSNLGVSVIVDDAGLRVIFPALTTERKQQILKLLKEKMEDAKIKVRLARDGVWSDIQTKEREGQISEDDKFRGKDELQKLVDEYNDKIKNLIDKKKNEII